MSKVFGRHTLLGGVYVEGTALGWVKVNIDIAYVNQKGVRL